MVSGEWERWKGPKGDILYIGDVGSVSRGLLPFFLLIWGMWGVACRKAIMGWRMGAGQGIVDGGGCEKESGGDA